MPGRGTETRQDRQIGTETDKENRDKRHREKNKEADRQTDQIAPKTKRATDAYEDQQTGRNREVNKRKQTDVGRNGNRGKDGDERQGKTKHRQER